DHSFGHGELRHPTQRLLPEPVRLPDILRNAGSVRHADSLRLPAVARRYAVRAAVPAGRSVPESGLYLGADPPIDDPGAPEPGPAESVSVWPGHAGDDAVVLRDAEHVRHPAAAA